MSIATRFICLIACFLFSQVATSYPEWSEYRTMDGGPRKNLDSAILSIVDKASDTGFNTKHIRFCAHDNNIWETSPNSSCASTEAAALKQSWPPPRTEEGFSFVWVAYMRLVNAYCAVNASDDACKILLPVPAPAPAPKKSARFGIFDLFFSVAQATEPCKIEEGTMTLKTGKKIFVDFGPQPSGKQIAYLYKTAALAASDAGVLDAFSQLKSMGRAVVVNYKSKNTWTTDHIRKDRVAWISIERTVEELGDRNGQIFANSFDLLKAQLAAKVPKDVADNATSSGICPSAPVCVWLHEKALRKPVRLLPVQSEATKRERLKLEVRLAKINDSLDALVLKKVVPQADVDIIKRQYGDMSAVMTPYSATGREAVRRRFGNVDVAAAMVGYYDVAEAFKKNTAEQEKSMAMVAIAQEENGIFSSTESRRATMIPILEAACRGPGEMPPELFPTGAPTKTNTPKSKKPLDPTVH